MSQYAPVYKSVPSNLDLYPGTQTLQPEAILFQNKQNLVTIEVESKTERSRRKLRDTGGTGDPGLCQPTERGHGLL